jgi:hypothetical protein
MEQCEFCDHRKFEAAGVLHGLIPLIVTKTAAVAVVIAVQRALVLGPAVIDAISAARRLRRGNQAHRTALLRCSRQQRVSHRVALQRPQ